MTTALALPKVVKVNACGRILEISSEASSSMPLLRRELVAKLRVCNPASLQLTDLTGKLVTTDVDLQNAMHEGKLPLQAKLTVAALHEIEQKKKEGRSKEHDMVGLQWQIVIEQVAAFSNELAAMGAHLQSVHDDSRKIVQQFEEAEALRREQLMDAIRNEASEREASHRDILAKMDDLAITMQDERSTREVTSYQLGKQIEQVHSEFNAHQNAQSQEQADFERRLASLRHELELAMQKNVENYTRNFEAIKRLESRDKEHTTAEQAVHQRVTAIEADCGKLRGDIDNLDIVVTKQMRDTVGQLKRYGEELERNAREGSYGRDHELALVAKENETSWQSLETQLAQLRDDNFRMQEQASERTKLLELRCAALEKEHVDRWDAQASKDHTFLDKVHKSETAMDAAKMDRYANEAVIRTTVSKVEELMERMRAAEANVSTKVECENWKAQMDTLAFMMQKQEMRVAQMEREFNVRVTQEAGHREELLQQLQNTVKTCFDKVAMKAAPASHASPPMQQAALLNGDSPAVEETTSTTTREIVQEYIPPAREFVRSQSPTLTRVRHHGSSSGTSIQGGPSVRLNGPVVSPATVEVLPASPNVMPAQAIPVHTVQVLGTSTPSVPLQSMPRVGVVQQSRFSFPTGTVRSLSPTGSSRNGQ